LQRQSLGNLQQPSSRPNSISSLYELVNATVTIPDSTGQTQGQTYNSPMSDTSSIAQYLPTVLDNLTTVKTSTLPARVNVNTAPSAVLTALPNLDPTTVQAILGTRPSYSSGEAPDSSFQTAAWLITQANVSPQTMQSLERYITAGSQVYRVQSVGHFDGPGPTARVEAVIDTNAGRPRIVYYRDLTSLGKGFDLPKNN
jgi:hypothetical protein